MSAKPWGQRWHAALARVDARVFQIAFLLLLLLFGALSRDFALSPWQVLGTFSAALATQAAWQFGLALPTRHQWGGYLSAVVTSCSLSILIRSDTLWVHPLLAMVAMSSKFVVRVGQGAQRGHVFNPANLACVLALWVLPQAWLSPGQWGNDRLIAFWLLILGAITAGRVARWSTSMSFLLVWLGLIGARLLWLGTSPSLAFAQWLHQAQNGAVLLFAFFMISDPMTTPQHRGARLAYAACVATLAFCWQFVLFRPHGPIVALFVASLTVPWWNARFGAVRFAWLGHGAAPAAGGAAAGAGRSPIAGLPRQRGWPSPAGSCDTEPKSPGFAFAAGDARSRRTTDTGWVGTRRSAGTTGGLG